MAFGAGKRDLSCSAVRVKPIPVDVPAWARQQPSDSTPREKFDSFITGRPHSNLPPIDRLITVAEAAMILHVSTKTVRRLIEQGELDSVRIGRSVRIRPADVERIIPEKSNG